MAEEQDRSVPEAQWNATLSGFAERHDGARVAVRIEDPDGRSRRLEQEAGLEPGELILMGLRREDRDGQPLVCLQLHQRPGAKIETVEVAEPTRLLADRDPDALVIEGADGHRVRVEAASPAAASA